MLARLVVTAAFILSALIGVPLYSPFSANNFGASLGSCQDSVRPSLEHLPSLELWKDALPSCSVTDLPDDPLVKEYGHNNIRLSRAYEGSGIRTRRMLRKALSGQPINIAVVGGSVSQGHGLDATIDQNNYYPERIRQWFTKTFPEVEHLLNKDSILAGITSHYFSFCISETLPEDVDLVIIELDINSMPPTPEMFAVTESLIRTILAMKSEPAVIYLSTFALVFSDMTAGWRMSALVAQWFDLPMINIRNFALPALLADDSLVDRYFKSANQILDLRHVNAKLHRAMGDMIIAYLREQLCLLQRSGPYEAEPENPDWPANDVKLTVPRLGILEPYDATKSWPVLDPKCKTVASTKFPLVPTRGEPDWKLINDNDKKSWEATKEGATVTFEVDTREGLLGFIFWKSKDPSYGSARCWVGNRKSYQWDPPLVPGYWPGIDANAFDYTGELWSGVSPGRHNFTCRIEKGEAGGTRFRISAVAMR